MIRIVLSFVARGAAAAVLLLLLAGSLPGLAPAAGGRDAGAGASGSRQSPAQERSPAQTQKQPQAQPQPQPKDRPNRVLPIVPSSRVSSRRLLVRALHQAQQRGDFALAAKLNGGFQREAAVRARRVLDAWKTLRDPKTGLVPRSRARQMHYWNTRDVAADLFPFLFYASHELDAADFPRWLDTMAYERAHCGPMPCSLAWPDGEILPTSQTETLFGAVEYAKDGLLAVTERLGEGPWLDRMIEDVDAILAVSPIHAAAGPLVAEGTEVNGEMLLVLSRLWQRTGNEKYIQAAERIADAYLFEVMPKNNGLPARMWNFTRSRPKTAEFRLRDHGSELFPGLGELYLVEKLAGRPAAARYGEPVRRFFDTVLALPRTADGMFRDSYDASTREARDADVTDTWGYLLTGLAAYDLAEGTSLYSAEIERVMRAAATRHSFQWESVFMDGYADSIESMLYHLPFHPIDACAEWVDEEIEVMFAKQQKDGFVEGWYLDGNFVRTTMLYATYKSMGTRVEPWSADLQLGAAKDEASGRLYVNLRSETAWTGRLRFDGPRHASTWHYPAEFPRLNGLPEWFTVDARATYTLEGLPGTATKTLTGAELMAGVPLQLGARETVRLVVRR